MKRTVFLLTAIAFFLSASSAFANWAYPQNSIVYNGDSYSMHHLKKSYERTIAVVGDAITPEDYGMIAYDLIQETDGLLCAMESIACDRCSMYYDRVMSIRHDAMMDLVSIYIINLSYDDAERKHKLFTLTQLIVSALLKSPCLQEYYPCLARFIRNTQIQTIYCRGMKEFRLEGQDLGIFINTLLDMTENPGQLKSSSKEKTKSSRSHYDCCGHTMTSEPNPEATPAPKPTKKEKLAAPTSSTQHSDHTKHMQAAQANANRASVDSSAAADRDAMIKSRSTNRFQTFGDMDSLSNGQSPSDL